MIADRAGCIRGCFCSRSPFPSSYGSVENLNVSARQGWIPKRRHSRLIESCETRVPCRANQPASSRLDQCVIPNSAGGRVSVADGISSRTSSVTVVRGGDFRRSQPAQPGPPGRTGAATTPPSAPNTPRVQRSAGRSDLHWTAARSEPAPHHEPAHHDPELDVPTRHARTPTQPEHGPDSACTNIGLFSGNTNLATRHRTSRVHRIPAGLYPD